LIEAFSDAEAPIALLVASAQEHIPLDTVGLTGELPHIPGHETGNLSMGSLRDFRNRSDL